jgi:acyl-CoA thioesterase
MAGTFADDVVVRPAGPGRYRTELGHDWDLVPLPQGGIVVALGLRAAVVELAEPDQCLRTCTAVFAGQVTAGTLEIEVGVLRRGRSASQVEVAVRNAGSTAGITIVAVFGAARPGPSFVDVAPPSVPAPEACPSWRDPPPPEAVEVGWEPRPTPFWQRLEGRSALGHPPWERFTPATSDVATWLRFDEPPVLADGSLDPLGVVVLADRMPGAVSERLGHAGDPFFAPSADLTVHLFEPLRTPWVLAHDRARWADGGWASGETTLWAEDGTLVAYATQMMLFTYLAP